MSLNVINLYVGYSENISICDIGPLLRAMLSHHREFCDSDDSAAVWNQFYLLAFLPDVRIEHYAVGHRPSHSVIFLPTIEPHRFGDYAARRTFFFKF